MDSKDRANMPIRVARDALQSAKIAASLEGMSVTEYASQVLREHANAKITEWRKSGSLPAAAKPPKKGK